MNMTWRDLVYLRPDFVQWVVAKYGPLPDGLVQDEEFLMRLIVEYEAEAMK